MLLESGCRLFHRTIWCPPVHTNESRRQSSGSSDSWAAVSASRCYAAVRDDHAVSLLQLQQPHQSSSTSTNSVSAAPPDVVLMPHRHLRSVGLLHRCDTAEDVVSIASGDDQGCLQLMTVSPGSGRGPTLQQSFLLMDTHYGGSGLCTPSSPVTCIVPFSTPSTQSLLLCQCGSSASPSSGARLQKEDVGLWVVNVNSDGNSGGRRRALVSAQHHPSTCDQRVRLMPLEDQQQGGSSGRGWVATITESSGGGDVWCSLHPLEGLHLPPITLALPSISQSGYYHVQQLLQGGDSHVVWAALTRDEGEEGSGGLLCCYDLRKPSQPVLQVVPPPAPSCAAARGGGWISAGGEGGGSWKQQQFRPETGTLKAAAWLPSSGCLAALFSASSNGGEVSTSTSLQQQHYLHVLRQGSTCLESPVADSVVGDGHLSRDGRQEEDGSPLEEGTDEWEMCVADRVTVPLEVAPQPSIHRHRQAVSTANAGASFVPPPYYHMVEVNGVLTVLMAPQWSALSV